MRILNKSGSKKENEDEIQQDQDYDEGQRR